MNDEREDRMKKIPTIFERPWDNPDPRARALVTDAHNPFADWVFRGEGVATEKIDGTSVLIHRGIGYKRYELKRGKVAPAGFIPADEVDEETGKQPGWVPVLDTPEDKWHREAFAEAERPDGTYELIGPKVQGNPYHFGGHRLLRHGAVKLEGVPTRYDDLRIWLERNYMEGIVWHHEDGRMAKIKRRDFGIRWP
jgi:hypothetical protein